jgi:hypothetical protein
VTRRVASGRWSNPATWDSRFRSHHDVVIGSAPR